MKYYIVLIAIISSFYSISISGQLTVTNVGQLPEPVSNNAVCEGFIDGDPYLFSFGGIDSTKIYTGIHLKSWRYNIKTGQTDRIADLPDDLGKIAMGASRIGNIIYIVGGYNVFANGSEISSRKVHRYDVVNDVFLEDAAILPTATDDHVQAVWRDSLIYVVTGWSNVTNTARVQIYNPLLDEWTIGDSVPFSDSYKSFGASGVIKDDEIIYFGGATSAQGFGIQNQVRRGEINPENPAEITWSVEIPDPSIVGYRMAAALVNDQPHWIGGSNNTFNFDGVAYDNSGGVEPNNRDLFLAGSEWNQIITSELPMDLRGIAMIDDTTGYIAGGMLQNQKVSNSIYELQWKKVTTHTTTLPNSSISISPNPVMDMLSIESDGEKILAIRCFDQNGDIVDLGLQSNDKKIDVSGLKSSLYYLIIITDRGHVRLPFVKI